MSFLDCEAIGPPSDRGRPVGVIRTGVLVLLVAVATAACSHYSFSPALRTHVRTIAVPIPGNETLEYGAEQDLTDAIIQEFSEDNTLRVVGEDNADSIIRGAVALYERTVLSYDSGGNPREYKVRVVAKLSYEDLTLKETVWESEVEGWAVYSTSAETGEPITEDEARGLAFEKLAEDVLARTIQGW
jgi:hypothetical protein